MDLSAIIITKNQEWNIERLIESIQRGAAMLEKVEIILVDSASTDATIERAQKYPIRIIQLQAEQRLTAAAGRHIGYKHSSGQLILFLDGDMELDPAWLPKALSVMENHPDIAVVSGLIIDLPKDAVSPGPNRTKAVHDQEFFAVKYTGGAAMHRRRVIENVGDFNPYLYSDEEPDLCIRIRQQGHRIVRLYHPMVNHYTDPPGGIWSLVGRWRRNLYLGAGQNLRYKWGTHLFWPYFKERGYGCVPLAGILMGLAFFIWTVRTERLNWFLGCLLLGVAGLAAAAYRKRSIYRVASSLLERLFIMDGTVRGFLMKPNPPDSYPAALEIIK
ncbi:MAG: glycosyltransferase [Caldilineaceae bacterium]